MNVKSYIRKLIREELNIEREGSYSFTNQFDRVETFRGNEQVSWKDKVGRLHVGVLKQTLGSLAKIYNSKEGKDYYVPVKDIEQKMGIRDAMGRGKTLVCSFTPSPSLESFQDGALWETFQGVIDNKDVLFHYNTHLDSIVFQFEEKWWKLNLSYNDVDILELMAIEKFSSI